MNFRKGTKGFISRPVHDRFFEKVSKTDGCWLWTGSIRRGYGQIWINGKTRMATQISWELFNNKPWPQGMDACHSCDNPPCVNPEHIFAGTKKENAQDALKKGRLKIPRRPRSFTCFRGHQKDAKFICRECVKMHNKARSRGKAALEGKPE